MSMDEQYREMVNFRVALIAFNEKLKASIVEMESHHDKVSGLWQDSMRRHYDAQWDPFRQTMKHYVKSEAPGYVEFLSIKMHKTERYLHGY